MSNDPTSGSPEVIHSLKLFIFLEKELKRELCSAMMSNDPTSGSPQVIHSLKISFLVGDEVKARALFSDDEQRPHFRITGGNPSTEAIHFF
ncbi:hypothetical protein JGC31_16310 [Zhouia sp. CL16]|nr:hypothetical protein [Zhouia amylolytica]